MFFFWRAAVACLCCKQIICIYTELVYDSNKKLTKARRIAKCLTGFTKIKYFYFRRIKNKTLETILEYGKTRHPIIIPIKKGYFHSLDDFLLILFPSPPPKTNPLSSFSLYKNNSYAGIVSNSYTLASITRSKI
jgi:hypothetical protein